MMKHISSLLQSVCVLCHSPSYSRLALCADCIKELPTYPQCRFTQSSGDSLDIYTHTLAPFRYEGSMRYLIIGLKFNKQLLYAHILGTLLADHIQQYYSINNNDLPDFLLPVPSHRSRLYSRGFNQAVEICRVLSKRLAIPILLQLVKKRHATQPQSTLSAQQRRFNLQHSFQLAATPPKDVRIAIVDDVITTGATLHEIAQLLHTTENTNTLYAWACAKTPISTC